MNWVALIIVWGMSNWMIGIFLNNNAMQFFGMGIMFGALGISIEADKREISQSCSKKSEEVK